MAMLYRICHHDKSVSASIQDSVHQNDAQALNSTAPVGGTWLNSHPQASELWQWSHFPPDPCSSRPGLGYQLSSALAAGLENPHRLRQAALANPTCRGASE